MTRRRSDALNVVPSTTDPTDATMVADYTPNLVDVGEHHLCPGCGEPIAIRAVMDGISLLGLADKCMAVFGIGCSTAFSNNLDVEVLQALHGRAPSVATGVIRMRPELAVVTIQGDGDMANEGLQEVLHAAARGENIVCIMLNNGVFGETGGHLTVTTTIGQRTKNTIEGRDAAEHGNPIGVAELLAQIDGVAYVARGAVNDAGNVARTKRMIVDALTAQQQGLGLAFVEILTMCPTGWFIPTDEAPDYLAETIAGTHAVGVLRSSLS
ncbi:MAG: thiamine pyrophosphate-dependent enzyme [Microthrixaceae bacterium]